MEKAEAHRRRFGPRRHREPDVRPQPGQRYTSKTAHRRGSALRSALDGLQSSDGQSAGGVGRGKEKRECGISPLFPCFGDDGWRYAGSGFLYPLQDALLPSGRSLGISNELLYHRGRIRIISGYLLIIQSSD
ncbi:MAG: hypothetical protein ACLR23_04925 [Clostridia bacterium]